ncbi:MAG: 30S ribosomal protein S21 [Bradyrhizobium sp.]|nr:30S ribosomal protein S21 [Bradyrhizobium sp.]
MRPFASVLNYQIAAAQNPPPGQSSSPPGRCLNKPSALLTATGPLQEELRQFAPTIDGATRVQSFATDNNVEQALLALKKMMQREGVFREMRRAATFATTGGT